MSVKVSVSEYVRRKEFLMENLNKLAKLFNASNIESGEIAKHPEDQGLEAMMLYLSDSDGLYERTVFETGVTEDGYDYDKIVRYRNKSDQSAPIVSVYSGGFYHNTNVDIATEDEGYLWSNQEIDELLKFSSN